MRIKFSLPLKPFSINRMFCRDISHKTADYKDWERAAVLALAQKVPQAAMAAFRQQFDASQHGIVVRMHFQIPEDILITKAGLLSSRAMDITNVEKPLLDILCLPKFHVQSAPFGCLNLNIDDKYVLRLTSTKSVSPTGKYNIIIHVSTMPIATKFATMPKKVSSSS